MKNKIRPGSEAEEKAHWEKEDSGEHVGWSKAERVTTWSQPG
jgi:hypothetical protein